MKGLFDDAEGYSVNQYDIQRISYAETKPFILDIHYAKRMPSISYAYGLYQDNVLIGMVSYGSPASPSLCKGVAGEENKHHVIELNRLVLKNNEKNQASILIAASFKLLPKPKIIVSYADTAQNHLGVVYQATNFIFTGTSKPRTDMAGKNGKHSRHHLGDKTKRVNRSAKHRYIYVLGSKTWKKDMMRQLKYKQMDYPKVNT
tara:strand:- start:2616 stop:3224 length:609 start_codon:yes stop_codon:yes gene_type:complete